jgi:hypothetical protein
MLLLHEVLTSVDASDFRKNDAHYYKNDLASFIPNTPFDKYIFFI